MKRLLPIVVLLLAVSCNEIKIGMPKPVKTLPKEVQTDNGTDDNTPPPPTGPYVGMKRLGLPSGSITAYATAIDSAGSFITAGSTDTAFPTYTLVGILDAFITKYNSDGTLAWIREISTTSSNTAQVWAVRTDASNNIYVAGQSSGPLNGAATSTSNNRYFVAKYSATGTQLWLAQFGPASAQADIKNMAIDKNNNVYIVGCTTGTLHTVASIGFQSGFVIKYAEDGTRGWTKIIGVNSGSTCAQAIAVDKDDDLIVTGNTTVGLETLTNVSDTELFISKLSSSTGTISWLRQMGFSSGSSATIMTVAVDTDNSGNIYTAGYVTDALPTQTLSGTIDSFITKYASNGTRTWVRQFGSTATSAASGMAVSKTGDIYISGFTQAAMDPSITQSAFYELFVTKYSTNGVRGWTRQLGEAGALTYTQGHLALDPAGYSFFVSGQSNANLDNQAPIGTFDGFIMKFDTATGNLK